MRPQPPASRPGEDRRPVDPERAHRLVRRMRTRTAPRCGTRVHRMSALGVGGLLRVRGCRWRARRPRAPGFAHTPRAAAARSAQTYRTLPPTGTTRTRRPCHRVDHQWLGQSALAALLHQSLSTDGSRMLGIVGRHLQAEVQAHRLRAVGSQIDRQGARHCLGPGHVGESVLKSHEPRWQPRHLQPPPMMTPLPPPVAHPLSAHRFVNPWGPRLRLGWPRCAFEAIPTRPGRPRSDSGRRPGCLPGEPGPSRSHRRVHRRPS